MRIKELILLIAIVVGSAPAEAQSFLQKPLVFHDFPFINLGTSLMFGPDGRLYVTHYTGSIYIYTIERDADGVYNVIDFESLEGLRDMQDHNDDGSLFETNNRQTLGLTVVGTADHPIVYVTSSDFRIGGGADANEDTNLDTNSGVITRYSWTGTEWEEVDIVRGLPRSEENHATNGLEFVTVDGVDYLIVSQGGNTNAGGLSVNFLFQCEYALSAAVLAVNLTAIEAMPILFDEGRQYIYDLPTVDDPTRGNANGIDDPDDDAYDGVDIGDPFGGNDGLNQAIIVPGGPVQVFSPGFRNTYDLVVTNAGAVYATENGANQGWGGFPTNEGSDLVNNSYDASEPGNNIASEGEIIDNTDHLHLITEDISSYTFGSHYAGHPNPIRANHLSAGLFTAEDNDYTTGVFRTLTYDPDMSRPGSTDDVTQALPANWPPVTSSNSIESDYRSPTQENPDGANDNNVVIWGTNTNGIDEYTASNFDGAMQGDLIAGHNLGNLRRVQLNGDGSVASLDENFASGIAGNVLGITCNGDDEIFAGTIWTAALGGGVVVLEPVDLLECFTVDDPSYDPNADYDFDRYTNADEADNDTELCNGGSQPSDFDKSAGGGTLISDLNDPDDDNDGIPDSDDVMQLGDPLDYGSDAFGLPVSNDFFSNTALGGYQGLGLTGLMNNGADGSNWLQFLDRRDDPDDPNPNDILGGAIGAMTMQMTSGTAVGSENTQEKAFQYGVSLTSDVQKFIVRGGLRNFDAPLQLYGNNSAPDGEIGFFVGDGTQSNFIMCVMNKNGFKIQQEINDVAEEAISIEIEEASRPDFSADLYFEVDRASAEIALSYTFDANPEAIFLTSVNASGNLLSIIQSNDTPLMVGLIGTSNASGIEVEGTWDYLEVFPKATWREYGEVEDYEGNHECGFVQSGDKFYLIGGRTDKGRIYSFDLNEENWSLERASSEEAFNHFQPVEYEGYIWLLSTFIDNNNPSESANSNVWIYDPLINEWIRGIEVPEDRRRGAAGAVKYKNKLYAIGGLTNGHNGGYVNWFDEYDPINATWKTMPDAPRARDHFSAVVHEDKLYLIGGRLTGGEGGLFHPLVEEVDVFDFVEQEWSSLDMSQNIPTPRASPSIAILNEKILVMGGEVSESLVYGETITGALSITEEYDVDKERWSRLEDMNYERHGTHAISSGGAVYIAAGSPNLGAGTQRNMEVFGLGEAEANAIIRPMLTKSVSEIDMDGEPVRIDLRIDGGNTGLYISSLDFSSDRIELTSGSVDNRLILPNTQIQFQIQCAYGLGDERDVLTIVHSDNHQEQIVVRGCKGTGIEATPIDTADQVSVEVLSTKDNWANDLLLYPNPAENRISITSTGDVLIRDVKLLTLGGQQLFEATQSTTLYEMDLTAYYEGTYILQVTTDSDLYERKVVIAR